MSIEWDTTRIDACILMNLAPLVAPAGFTPGERAKRENAFSMMLDRHGLKEVIGVIATLIYALPDTDAYVEAQGCEFWPSDRLSLQLVGWDDELAALLRPVYTMTPAAACTVEWGKATIVESLTETFEALPNGHRGDAALALLSAVVFRLTAYGVPSHHVLEAAIEALAYDHLNDDHAAHIGQTYRPHPALASLVNLEKSHPAPGVVSLMAEIDTENGEIPF